MWPHKNRGPGTGNQWGERKQGPRPPHQEVKAPAPPRPAPWCKARWGILVGTKKNWGPRASVRFGAGWDEDFAPRTAPHGERGGAQPERPGTVHRDGAPEVMNDKGGLKKEEVFRRSGFLVLFLFF